jgi:hypothetical protein
MKPRIVLLNLVLTVILLASCAPKSSQPPAAPIDNAPQVAATQAPENASQALPTSRGDKLEATDPATVSLASGDLQLVEFFRFT